VGDSTPESEGSGGISAEAGQRVASRPPTSPNAAGATPYLPDGIALQPVLEIGDRSAVGYEVLRRPSVGSSGPIAEFERILAVVPIVNPAILVVPADEELFNQLGDDLLATAAAAGVMPAELMWLLPALDGSLPGDRLERARWLVSLGFGLALDGIGVASLAHEVVADLQPAFAMLEPELTQRVRAEPRARAEVAALMSYFGRLGTRTIVRGVDEERSARLWLELGLQLGVGRYLHPSCSTHQSRSLGTRS
jgi:EAL domain-containing protein (putative c-di-GMP-specific phosphodiesterase class I)